ncbi:MAG: hypothetical protein ACJAU2_001371 [Maribacter sp.]|jgi:hypothetical protein
MIAHKAEMKKLLTEVHYSKWGKCSIKDRKVKKVVDIENRNAKPLKNKTE